MTTRGQIRSWGSLAAVLALLLSACGGTVGPADPTEALVDAVERSFSGSFAFEVGVELDEAAREELASGDVPVSALLDSLRITGYTAGDDALAVAVTAMGQDLFELRQTDATHIYLRTDAAGIAETFGVPLNRDEMLAEAQQTPPAVTEMLTGLLDGRWVGVIGEPSQGPNPDAMMLRGGMDPSEMEAARQEAFGDSPGEFARRFATAAFAEDDAADVRVLDVRLLTRAMAEAMHTVMLTVHGDEQADDEQMHRDLEHIPETVGGVTVEVSNRLVERVTVDVFEAARSLGESAADMPAGSLRLIVDVSEHGTAGPVTAPDDVLEIAAEDLGQHHPGAFLPLGLGSGMMWPLMWVIPMRVGSSMESVESVEGSMEIHPPPEDAPAVEMTAAPAEPVPSR